MINEAAATTNFELKLELERRIKAPIDRVFEALLDELGPQATTPEANPMSMKIEPFPGGRWYRDLGGDNGHHWALVQAIRRPDLLELVGPLFMSLPVTNNVQYRLVEDGGTTTLKLVHTAFGPVPDDVRQGMTEGWGTQLDKLVARF
jgi:uncharacterized protein YndB with AHSA1/START domain